MGDVGKGSLSNLGIEQNLQQKLVQKYAHATVLESLRYACTSTYHLLLYMCLDATQPSKLALPNSHFSPSVTFGVQQLEYLYHSRLPTLTSKEVSNARKSCYLIACFPFPTITAHWYSM